MILNFSTPIILIVLFCFIFCYKYFFKNKMLINIILDFLIGTIFLSMSTSYLKNEIQNSNGHGGAIIYLFNFIFFTILYITSYATLYWKKSMILNILIPTGIYFLFVIYVILFFDFAKIYEKTFLYSIFLSFFPIYIYNYLQIFSKQLSKKQ